MGKVKPRLPVNHGKLFPQVRGKACFFYTLQLHLLHSKPEHFNNCLAEINGFLMYPKSIYKIFHGNF